MLNKNITIKDFFYEKIEPTLKQLQYPLTIKSKKLNLYAASGEKSHRVRTYYKIFLRDSFYTSFLLKDPDYLKNLLEFSILTQGKKKNFLTGEEPGKMLHELPEFWFGSRSTKYNTADTTPLFLIALNLYCKLTRDFSFIKANIKSIDSCLDYIFRHLKAGTFWDDPKGSGADKFALRATYWRDGGLIGRKNHRLKMPASYLMLQAQLVNALRIASDFSKRFELSYTPRELNLQSSLILESIFTRFWNPDTNLPLPAIDKKGPLTGVYSDFLHIPFYLNKKDIPRDKRKRIFEIASWLETPFGYKTYTPYKEPRDSSWLWYDVIWPWEQAYIALGALKFKRKDIAKKAKNVLLALSNLKTPFIEYFYLEEGKPKPSGCHIQLWTVAAVKSLLELKI